VYNFKIKQITAAACLALIPLVATATGLGKLTVISGLGEPLNAEIELLATTKVELSSLSAHVASSSVYAEQGIELASAVSAIRIELTSKSDGTPVLKLTTPQPVNDPFLDMLISVDWSSGRLLREYTALLDPPGFSDQGMADTTAAPVVRQGSLSDNAEKAQPIAPPVAKKGVQHGGKAGHPVATQEPPPRLEASGEEYTTRRGDTLRSVASRMPVQDVSLDRLLVGLYQANRNAFAGDNMNRLKVGQILRLPTEEELQAINQQQAAREVRIQAADWNAYRNKLASAVAESAPAKEEAPSQSATGKITAPAEDKAMVPVTGPHDVVKLSKSDTGPLKAGSVAEGRGAKAGAQDQLAALQEEVTAREKAYKEANDRVASLGKQVQEMKNLLELKNKTLAGAQTAEPPTQTALPVTTPQSGTAPAQAKPEVPAQAPTVSQAPEAKLEGGEPKHRKLIKPPPAEPEQEKPGFVGNWGLLTGAIGGLIAALGGAWLYFRNKRRKGLGAFKQGIQSTGLKPNSESMNAASSAVNTGDTSFMTDFSHGATGGGLIDTHDVDPVAEAEVYMAYGRDVHAEEILKDGLVKEPRRVDLRTKLLEIYANRKDTAAFETLAGEFYATFGAAEPAWAKIAEKGRELQPGNPLYAAQSAAQSVGASMDAAQSPELDIAASTEPGSAEVMAEPIADSVQQVAAEPEQTAGLDFSFDLPEPPAQDNVQLDAAELGFESLLELPAHEQPVESPPVDVTATGGLDFDFDVDLGELESSVPNKSEESSPIVPEIDLSGISLNLDEGENPVAEIHEDKKTTAQSAKSSDVDTKLNLVTAYLDMGDKESARELLQEVLQDGGPRQRNRAKKLLDTL
jgi:pilus assembly protein FimV